MDNSRLTEEVSMKNVLDGFMDSYAKRDKSMEFSDWLERKLQQEIPDMSEEASKRLVRDIIGAVSDYDKTLEELNAAIDAGQSKEEWFADRLADTYADMPMDAVGEKLQQFENNIAASNMQLMRGIDMSQTEEENSAEAGNTEWNEYSIKDKAYKIGKQVVLSGMAVAANVAKDKMQNDSTVEIGDISKGMLQDGVIQDPEEVKAVVAGAVKVAAEKGLVDIPDAAIGDMAGVAVEGAEALYDAACGECTMTEALDKIGRAGVAAGCRYCAGALKGFLLSKPFGPLLVDLFGGLLDHMESPKFTENVYTVVRDAAIATWEGMKKSVGRIFGSLKRVLLC